MRYLAFILITILAFSCTKEKPIDKSHLIGENAPKFENYENYDGGTSSSDDFLGKYMYIDLWATTCFPCAAQIIALEELKVTYKDKNIAFVSISLDDDIEKWKERIDSDQMKGVQLYTSDGWEASFIKAFNVTYIPKAILINDKGVVVQSDAPWPAETEKIIELFKDIE